MKTKQRKVDYIKYYYDIEIEIFNRKMIKSNLLGFFPGADSEHYFS